MLIKFTQKYSHPNFGSFLSIMSISTNSTVYYSIKHKAHSSNNQIFIRQLKFFIYTCLVNKPALLFYWIFA